MVYIRLYDNSVGELKTGQAASLTAYISLDGNAFTTATNAISEVLLSGSGTGIYKLDLTKGETEADFGYIYVKHGSNAKYVADAIAFETRLGIADDTYAFNTTGYVGNIAGGVGGNVFGSVGSVAGDVNGAIRGNIGSSGTPINIFATYRGNVGADGSPITVFATHSGTHVGNLNGYVVGGISGNVTGSVGSVSGNINGKLLNDIGTVATPVEIYANVRGNLGAVGNRISIHGDIEGNLNGDVSYNVNGAILGNIGQANSPVNIYGSVTGSVNNVVDGTEIANAVAAKQYDGITQEKLNEMLIALLANKVTITTGANNTQTISYLKRDGTTEVLNVTVSTVDGSRSITGTIT